MNRLPTFAFLFVAAILTSCGGEEPVADTSDDSIVPVGIDSYVADTTNQAVCIGIDPTAGITENHHQQCVDWNVIACTDTGEQCLDLFKNNPNNSECCCETCGVQQGEPTCFFLVCP